MQNRLNATKDKTEKKLIEKEFKGLIAALKNKEDQDNHEEEEFVIQPFTLKQKDVSRSEKRRDRMTQTRQLQDKIEREEFDSKISESTTRRLNNTHCRLNYRN